MWSSLALNLVRGDIKELALANWGGRLYGASWESSIEEFW